MAGLEMRAEPFEISVPQGELDNLARRLESTRWAPDLGNADWRYGVESEWLHDMVTYWRHEFDWRAEEAAMNSHPHYLVEIEENPIHFIHVRGTGPAPIPLILSHGWPWTFWDFRDLIGPLTNPAAYGGDPDLAFDLVIPSLPGFGFSPLRRTGINVPVIASLWLRLMQDVLGYSRFAAAGGDWGAAITAYMGHAYPDALIGIYCTMPLLPGLDPADVRPEDYAAGEQWMLARNREAWPLIISHMTVQTRDPQTLAYALTDSPVGTAAWLWERRRAWSDCEGEVLTAFDRDALCTLASIYWLTETTGSSFRIYAEQFQSALALPLAHQRHPVIEVPTGFGIFPKEVNLLPRSLVERKVNLQHWAIHPRGGHFAPAEQPHAVLKDLRAFYASLRSGRAS